jgi:cytochrome c oxidase subunit 2
MPFLSNLLPNSTFSVSSPQASEITGLTLWVFFICTLIFIFVAVWIGYSVVKFRHRGEEGEPDQVQINKNYEVTWTIIPTLICILLGWMTVKSMFGPTSGEADPTPEPDIVITGAQWWWEIRYPKLGIVTANELHLPAGRPFVVQLDSNDVIHTFWIPDLGRKQQMIPGHHYFITVQHDVVGESIGACAQYCGDQHAWMRLLLKTESPADFDAWVAAQKAGASASVPPASTQGRFIPGPGQVPSGRPPIAPEVAAGHPSPNYKPLLPAVAAAPLTAADGMGDVARGLATFKQETCASCHSIDGVSTARYAPDLSHIAGRETLAAGRLVNNRDNLFLWLRDPQAIKPGCKMPNFQLTESQANDLTAYLESLK